MKLEHWQSIPSNSSKYIMAAVATTSGNSKGSGPASNPEQVLAGLNVLRGEQRSMATKLSELQMDLNEHK